MAKNEDLEQALRKWVGHVMRISVRSFARFCAEAGLTVPQAMVLLNLAGKRTCRVTALGDDLGVSGAAASQMVEKLVNLGLVTRIEDPLDRRARTLSLTDAGKALVSTIMQSRQEWLRRFCERFEPEEAAQAVRQLERFVQVIEEMQEY